jgi:DNA-binding CsgD family transcriptional regulator
MEEWGGEAIRRGEKHRKLVQRVARALERGGNEANSLARRGKLSLLGEAAETDDEISKFELQEEARQKIAALEEKAGLSKQQAEIWRRLRRGMEIAEIAGDLDIPGKQVSTQKRRIKRKMQSVREAVGF